MGDRAASGSGLLITTVQDFWRDRIWRLSSERPSGTEKSQALDKPTSAEQAGGASR